MDNCWLSKIKEHFIDQDVDEVIINSTLSSLVIYNNTTVVYDSIFSSVPEMIKCCQLFSLDRGVRLDPLLPFAGGQYDKSYRWHCILPPVAECGPIFSLRRHRFSELQLHDFATQDICNQIIKSYKNLNHLLICGATGSGKTSFCTTLLRSFSLAERVCIIEEYAEIPPLSTSWMKLNKQSSRVDGKGFFSLNSLFKQCLRIYPQRIVLGEIKDEEWQVFLQMISSAHLGCLATLHASSISDVKTRLFLSLEKNLHTKTIDSFLHNVRCVFLKREDGSTKAEHFTLLE
jgi:pilus assembly protein CpaF